jgi:hypothetical protein
LVKYEEMDFSTGSSADIPNESPAPGFRDKVEEYISGHMTLFPRLQTRSIESIHYTGEGSPEAIRYLT